MSTGFADEPGSRDPGLDHLIRALTADGYPRELAGLDAALAAFRAASSQSRRGFTALPGAFPRLSAAVAALVIAFAGLTAAAYAKALPAPVQHIAYSVLSPFGVPDSQPAPAAHSLPAPMRSAGHARLGEHATSSPSAWASCPCPAHASRPAVKGSALVLRAAREQLPANGWDQFSGRETYQGRPEPGVRIRLLEQPDGSGGWIVAGGGVTGAGGRVRIGVQHLTRNAIFRLAGPDGVSSTAISVTVIPRVQLWRAASGPGTDRLAASARFGDVGDVMQLQELSGGVWQSVASGVLDVGHQASFAVPARHSAGRYYRVLLEATKAHGASVSTPVYLPRLKTHTGRKAIVPISSPGAPRLPRSRSSPSWLPWAGPAQFSASWSRAAG